MRNGRRNPWRKLVAVVVVLGVLAGGLFVGHKYRKRAARQRALAAGLAAYEAKDYTKAATELGRYLVAERRNTDVLMKYADANMRRRPQSRATLQQALSALETVLRIQRGEPKASEVLGQLYLDLELPVEAERVARAWKETSPADAKAARLLVGALHAQQKKEKTDEAAALLETLTKTFPADAESAARLAFLKLSRADGAGRSWAEAEAEAAGLLDAAVAADPASVPARIARARLRLALAARSRAAAGPATATSTGPGPAWSRLAAEDIEAAEKAGANDARALLELGILLLELRQFDRAKAQFDLAEKAEPGNPIVYNAVGQIALDRGDVRAGAALADRALAAPLHEQRLDILPLIAELYVAANRPADAKKCIDEIRRASPEADLLFLLDGSVAMAEARNAEGIRLLEEYTRRAPKAARGLLLLGQAYHRNGELRRAEATLKQYLQLVAPSPAPKVRIELAEIYSRLGRPEDAAKVAAEARNEAWDNAAAILTSMETRALVARPRGTKPDPEAIRRLYEECQNLVRQVPNEVRLQLLLARLAAWGGRLDEAVTVLDSVRRKPDAKLAATTTLIDLYAEAGQNDRAIAECEAAVRDVDEDRRPLLQTRLAELYAAKGDAKGLEAIIEALSVPTTRPAASAALLGVAQLLLRQNQPERARAAAEQVAARDEKDIASRHMLLSMPPPEGKPDNRPELVNQLQRIEGEGGLHWRLWRARLLLESDGWQANRSQIETLLNECLAKDPGWDEASLTQALVHEKAGENDKALAIYRRLFAADRSNEALARRLLAVAARAGQWAEVDQALDALPADDPTLRPLRVARAARQGKPDEAAVLLEQQAKADPRDYQARLQLAMVKRATSQPAEVQRLLDEAGQIAPDAPEVLIARVEHALSNSQWDRAMELCNASIAKAPTPQAYAMRATTLDAMGKTAEAEKDLREVAKTKDWEERGWLALGQLYQRHDQLDRALQNWREGLAVLPKSVPIRRSMALAMLAGGDKHRDEGFKLLEQLLVERPDDEVLLLAKGDYVGRADTATAEAIYEDVVRRYPNSVEAYRRLAVLAADRGKRERALEMIQRGLSVNPRDLTLLFLKSRLQMADSPNLAAVTAGQAAGVAKAALTARPNDEMAARQLAEALMMSGRADEAVKELDAFLAANASLPMVDARLLLAQLHIARKEFARADAAIRKAAEAVPDDSRPVEVRIVWHAVQGQWDAIIALAGDYAREHAADGRVALTAARALMSPDAAKPDAAVPFYEIAVQRIPDAPVVVGELGMALYQLGRIAEAKAAFERAVKALPNDVGLANNLAWILCENDGDPAAAEKLIAGLVKSAAADRSYPNLLDTWGVVQYRLHAKDRSRQRLEESRDRLRECIRNPRADEATKASGRFHLARTLAELDPAQGREELAKLLADEKVRGALSPPEQHEAGQLHQRLQAGSAAVDAGR